MKKEPRYATEADLCADFIKWVQAASGVFDRGQKVPVWTPYAETAGWDILLVAEDGTQIGVQAKLKFNMKVLHQTIPETWDEWHDRGPDYRAVLVPEYDGMVNHICRALGIMPFYSQWRGYGAPEFSPSLHMHDWNGGWHYWSPRKRCALPEFVPDVVAGASGPVQLTQWKVAALRLIATLELQGFLTRQDFKVYSVDPRRWTGPSGWLVSGPVPGQWLRGPGLDIEKQHPVVYAQVLEEVRAKFIAAEPKRDLLGEVQA